MAYKRELISANQPIQLLDKSKYSATTTNNGVTFTNNGDGTITMNGTSTASNTTFRFQNVDFLNTHTYLLIGCPSDGGWNKYLLDTGANMGVDTGEGRIAQPKYKGNYYVGIYMPNNVTVTNVTFKPQLFDLTATFGAGNEPSTVAEFKAKYPNDLYDYRTSNSLTSYKKLLKVSDVCQLHSPKNFRSGTSATVSFESTDGKTWVVNGTSDYTGVGRAFFQLSADKIELIKNHHYLLRGAMENWYDGTAVNIDNKSAGTIDGLIFEQATTIQEYLYIAVNKNPYTNAVFKPQLYDLTEMYGAGNEPSTVAEFKAKFPNELYDYSPRCWVTSYKTGLIAPTKNLFNINALTPYTPETLPRGSVGVYNGQIIAKAKSNDTVCTTGKTLQQLCPDLVVGETYVLYFKTTTPSSVGGQYESIKLSGVGHWWRTIKRTITQADLSAIVGVYAETDGNVYTISNFQIEKGSTATDYVPYGYL